MILCKTCKKIIGTVKFKVCVKLNKEIDFNQFRCTLPYFIQYPTKGKRISYHFCEKRKMVHFLFTVRIATSFLEQHV